MGGHAAPSNTEGPTEGCKGISAPDRDSAMRLFEKRTTKPCPRRVYVSRTAQGERVGLVWQMMNVMGRPKPGRTGLPENRRLDEKNRYTFPTVGHIFAQ